MLEPFNTKTDLIPENWISMEVEAYIQALDHSVTGELNISLNIDEFYSLNSLQ